MTDLTTMPENYDNIRSGIVELLKAARSAAARNVNSIMTATYWEIGRRIVLLEQGGMQRAGYGEQLIEQLAADLTGQFGRGFKRTNLWQMRAFYLAWPQSLTGLSFKDIEKRSTSTAALAARFTLPWSAYVRLLSVKNPDARSFYESEALRSGWSVRQLDRQIGSQFYERIALSRNKAAILEKAQTPESSDTMTPEEAIKAHSSSNFWTLRTSILNRIWKRHSSGISPTSCWSWATISLSSAVSGGSASTTTGFASILFSSTAVCAACFWPT